MKYSVIAILLVVLAALGLVAGPFGASTVVKQGVSATAVKNTSVLVGNVVSGDVAIPGLTVIVRTTGGDTLGTTFTDDQGHFQVSDLPSDEDTARVVEVRWGGSKLIMRRHLLVTGAQVPVTFRLN